MTWIEYDQGLIADVSSRMDLRQPNEEALATVIENIHTDEYREVVCDLATGVGKTYITAALIDYLAGQGVRNVLIVTPGKTIQDKTINNFTPGHPKFVPGGDYQPILITAENFNRGGIGDALHDSTTLKLFVFNVQQLIKPATNMSRKTRVNNEFIGSDLYSHLKSADDLVVIADEHHVYRGAAKAFSSAVRDLSPRALVGLTATPDKADESKVIYRYSLAAAIADHLVKVPVIAYRKDGQTDERTQLADACRLLEIKAAAYRQWTEHCHLEVVNPVLFVVCQTVEDATEAANLLATDEYFADPDKVLLITGQSSDTDLLALSEVERPESPVRAVVSVDKLKEGWDVKNIAVIVALRRLASETLTEQILGRGLRLPFGKRVGVPMIDQVDVVAHDSYKALLQQKDSLIERVIPLSAPSSSPAATISLEAAPRFEEYGEQGTLRIVGPARIIEGDVLGGSAGLLIQELSATFEQGQRDTVQYKVLARVPHAPQIRFPRREREVIASSFTLLYVTDADASTSGAAFATEIDVPLNREALNATRTLDGGVKMSRESQDSEVATQSLMSVDDVATDLETRVLNLGLIESTLSEAGEAKRVVRAFLEGAGAGHQSSVSWGVQRAQLAANGIENLVRAKFNLRRLQPQFTLRGVVLPVEGGPMPTDVADRWNDHFERGRWFTGWNKSIMPVAAFDAKTTEWALADIMDRSKNIKWWLRLQTNQPAYIELPAGRYFADFIAIDDSGVYWLVEGKADTEMHSPDVIAKRDAAMDWVAAVNDSGAFGVWRYMICSESSIRNSAGGWTALVNGSAVAPLLA
ncbi:DEAD/DEAH box helicase family protein [Arthrobacter sp. UYEF21]|uniref:DEAD/DEAH box helicase n=1 Tax=Arthrobacter sp. UYEF21 TaxID=1756364 RepID=UPI0033924629